MTLSDLDFSDIGSWPWAAKVVFLILVSLSLLGAGYWFDTRHQLEQLERERRQEQSLKRQLEGKWKKAANLEAYRRQMKEIQEAFGVLLRQLPNKTEVADLLVDISETGLANGLEFDLFKPLPEVQKDFYAELPIQIKVRGNYHQFGHFVSDVANLPRIVTLHDFDITPAQGPLTMDIRAKTYRYLEEEAP
ncbi:MAG: pilus assembly protein PilO [Gammaproteobacteria bacterium]|nr:MAG: pilus assembly protein PilO [Gammaproteobacteria bacterium]